MFVYVSLFCVCVFFVFFWRTLCIVSRSQYPPLHVYLCRWGDKENGVAGHGDTEGHQYTPKLLERLSGKKVVQLSACGFHTGCLTDMGEVRVSFRFLGGL